MVCDKKLEGNRSGQNLLGVLKVENIQMLATVQENSRITLLSTHALFCASDSATDIDLPVRVILLRVHFVQSNVEL